MGTTFLATVMGWYLVIMGLLVLLRQTHVRAVMTDILADKAAFFVFGIMSLIVGLLVVVSHNVWVMNWPVAITIIGWLILVSSCIRLFFPKIAIKMGRAVIKNQSYLPSQGAFWLFIGIYLLYKVHF